MFNGETGLRVAIKEVLQADGPVQKLLVLREEQVLRELSDRPYSVQIHAPVYRVGASAFLVTG